jgi:hypothetical protein
MHANEYTASTNAAGNKPHSGGVVNMHANEYTASTNAAVNKPHSGGVVNNSKLGGSKLEAGCEIPRILPLSNLTPAVSLHSSFTLHSSPYIIAQAGETKRGSRSFCLIANRRN